MVFSRTSVSLVLTYQGQQIEQVPDFRYLGWDLHQSKGFTFSTSHLLAVARKALFGLKRRCMKSHITDASQVPPLHVKRVIMIIVVTGYAHMCMLSP